LLLLRVPAGDARNIGELVEDHHGMLLTKTGIGGTRVVDVLSASSLPRIC
jgi:hydrogenase expression/formation protein HypE